MDPTRAALVAVTTFVVGMGIVAALFAMLDVRAAFAIGPAMAVAAGAYAAYRLLRSEAPASRRHRVGR